MSHKTSPYRLRVNAALVNAQIHTLEDCLDEWRKWALEPLEDRALAEADLAIGRLRAELDVPLRESETA